MRSRVRVYVGCSLDGFIAGVDDDLSWLGEPPADGGDDYGFADFLAQIGAILMGRRTYDIVAGFAGPWPYGDLPLLVATHRPLSAARPEIEAVAGPIDQLVGRALAAAGDRDVYVDGGVLIRHTLDAGLIDELCVSVIPMILGAGIPLFAGAKRRQPLELLHTKQLPQGMVKLTYCPKR